MVMSHESCDIFVMRSVSITVKTMINQIKSSVAFGFNAHRALNAAIEYKNLDVYRVTKDLLEWAVGSKMKNILSRSSNIHTAVDATGENIKANKGGDSQSKSTIFGELHDQLDLLKPFYSRQSVTIESFCGFLKKSSLSRE